MRTFHMEAEGVHAHEDWFQAFETVAAAKAAKAALLSPIGAVQNSFDAARGASSTRSMAAANELLPPATVHASGSHGTPDPIASDLRGCKLSSSSTRSPTAPSQLDDAPAPAPSPRPSPSACGHSSQREAPFTGSSCAHRSARNAPIEDEDTAAHARRGASSRRTPAAFPVAGGPTAPAGGGMTDQRGATNAAHRSEPVAEEEGDGDAWAGDDESASGDGGKDMSDAADGPRSEGPCRSAARCVCS